MMQPDDERQDQAVSLLSNELALLHWQWLIWRTLYASKERLELLEKSAWPFFYHLQQILLNQVFVSLSRLTDPASQKGFENLSLERLLQHPKVIDDPIFYAAAKQKLDMATKACDEVRVWRNKMLAHLDFETNLAGADTVLPPVSRKAVEDALRALADAFNAVNWHLYKQQTAFDRIFSPPGDAEGLIRCLEYAQKWREHQIRLLLEGQYEGGL